MRECPVKPRKWECCGYNEIQNPRARKGLIDFDRLMELLGLETYEQLRQAHFKWVDSAIQAENKDWETKWTQSIAVGSEPFIEKIKEALGFGAKGRKISRVGDSFELRESLKPCGTTNVMEPGNTFLWDQ